MEDKKIVGIGEIVWDMLPAGKQLGGAPLNFAYFAKELGAKSNVISAIGDDELGKEALRKLSVTGVNINLLQRNNLPTGKVLISIDSEGIPNYEIIENVAWDHIECSSGELELLCGADAICWGSLAQRSETSKKNIIKMLDAAPVNCLRVFDINIRQHYCNRDIAEESLKRAVILKLNDQELLPLSEMFGLSGDEEERLVSLIKMFDLKEVIYTQGALCSDVYDRSGLLSRIMTPRVKVADTVGAGDSFTAAYIVSRINEKDIITSHKKAVEVSAFVCTQSGAINPIPQELI
ncbi:MAG TPA: fructokinase [Rikenellaceae bacterium]|jgi:fructokinase|nr:MAG: fructokinase [Bacteroidetes bacterium GWE2_40_15]HBZ25394.1 fructokinase [Rikenellaceae bacterium]